MNVESALEVGVFSLYINVNYEIKFWRGPQAAQNTLGPSNIFFWTPFGVYNNPTKGFGPNFFGLEYIWDGPEGYLGASWRPPWFSTYEGPLRVPKKPQNQLGSLKIINWHQSTQYSL